MKLALECPTGMLNDIQPLADFDWVLAHLVLQDKEYAEYYRKSKRYKVLDNSVNELLEPLSFGDMLKAMDIVKPSLVVPPDHLGGYKKTYDEIVHALSILGPNDLLPVIQGSTLGEVLGLLQELLSLGFNRLAVPYDILSSREDNPVMMASNRLRVVNSVINRVPIGFEIHLLGMTTIEELESHNRGWVRSVDTGVPVMMGLKGRRLDTFRLEDKKKSTMSRMENIVPVDPIYDMMNVFYNVAYLRKLLND